MERRMRFILCLSVMLASWPMGSGSDEAPSQIAEQPDNLAHAVNEFGYRLMKSLIKTNDSRNVVISPTGVAGLLAMTLLGSVGKTYDELATTLGFSQDILKNRKNHEQFGELLQQLYSSESNSRTLYADAILVDEGTQLRQVYRQYLKRVYNGDALTTQFRDSGKTKDLINEWVKNHTNGNIEDFIEKPLPADTKVVLLCALYFSGQWDKPFIPDYTRKMPFKTLSGEILADLMLNVGDFKSIREEGLYMLAFPYKDNVTVMYALKPQFPSESTLSEVLDRIDYAKIDKLINKMTKKNTVVRMPKMELKSKVNLEESLKALGVKTVFVPKEANFALMVEDNSVANSTGDELVTRINNGDIESRASNDIVKSLPNPGVYIDSVLHDVQMTVDEFGTEASAATIGILARTADQFYANTPFYMFIRNEMTKLVTFSAVIFDPTSKM